MRPTKSMQDINPGFTAGDSLIFADWLEERGEDTGAWVLRHPGTVARPQARTICEAVGYRGRKIRLEAVDDGQEIELHNNYWDGGGRSYWWQTGTNGKNAGRFGDGHPIYNRPQGAPKAGDGWLIVEHVIVWGIDLGIHIYGTPITLHRLFGVAK